MNGGGRKRAVYAAIALVALNLGILCAPLGWQGTAEWHTLIETICLVLELMAGAIALKAYYTAHRGHLLVLGSGLVGAACLDGCHILFTESFPGRGSSMSGPFTAWSDVAPPIFLALFLSFQSLAPGPGERLLRRRGEWAVYAAVALSALATLLVLSRLPRVLAFNPRGPVYHPADLAAALFFTLAAWGYFRKTGSSAGGMEHWLILALVTAASGHLFFQVFVTESLGVYFFVFHLFKMLSFVLMVSAQFASVAAVYRREAEAVFQLQRANQELAVQMKQRELAEEELRRSHDQLEMRVRERTRDLEEQSRQLRAAHEETELFLANIPSILIGLDPGGRITRWNPTAAEAFAISAGDAMGRRLDECGIDWQGVDIASEVSRWLHAKTIFRCDELAYEKDGNTHFLGLSIRPIPALSQAAASFLITGADVTERRKAQAAQAHLAAVVESSDAAIITVDLAGRILSWNAAAERIYGYSMEAMKGRSVSIIYAPERIADLATWLRRLKAGERIAHTEVVRLRKGGERVPVSITFSPIHDASGNVVAACSISIDITERKLLERQLAQAQKLESIGQLAAGIAHEINTPIQYVGDNIRFLRDSFARIEHLFQGYDRLLAAVRQESAAAAFVADIDALAKATRVGYLRAEIPKSIEDSLDGAGRVAEIVRAIKEFSHPGAAEKTPVDINRAIESTVLVSRNEWKYVADLRTDLDLSLPSVPCVPGEFNQVVLNLIVNAVHAIADVVAVTPGAKGAITISTHRDGGWAEIRVRDTGTGIPPEVQPNIFDPFFTTKVVGKGTGQGLAIAHNVIVHKHGGAITFDTVPGAGTTFKIRLPLGDNPQPAASCQETPPSPAEKAAP